MLDNFIFSLSVSLPIFLVMLSGFVLRRTDIIDEKFVISANFIVFYIALPLKLFNSISRSSIMENFDYTFIAFTIIGTIISIVLIYFYSKLFISDPSKLGAFIHGSFRGNFIYLGLSLLENVTGTIGTQATLIVAFVVPLYNILAVIILSLTNPDNKAEKQFKNMFKSMLTNPFIVSISLGILASFINFRFPVLLQNTFNYFYALATPLALITIGATFKIEKLFSNLKVSVAATIFKLFINPVLAVLAAVFVGLDNEEVFIIFILFGVPSAISSYIITTTMGGDKDLAASIVMMTTLFSVFSLTFFVFMLKLLAII